MFGFRTGIRFQMLTDQYFVRMQSSTAVLIYICSLLFVEFYLSNKCTIYVDNYLSLSLLLPEDDV